MDTAVGGVADFRNVAARSDLAASPLHVVAEYVCALAAPIVQRRLDRSVVFLDLYPAVDPFDAFSLAGDGHRLVGRFP
jgi:hypothetical protein